MGQGSTRQRTFDFESCAESFQRQQAPKAGDVVDQNAFDAWRDIANRTDPSMGTGTAADMLQMHRITFIRLIRNGKGPVCRRAFGDSGSTMIRLSDFLAWVRQTGRVERLVGPCVLGVKSVQQPAHARGVVYFIGDDAGAVKIGVTRRPVAERLTQLQTSNSRTLRCIAVIPAGREMLRIERDAHKCFSAYRMRGEWFNISPDEAVAYAIAHGGREWL